MASTQPKTKGETMARRNTSTETWIVIYSDHDMGAKDGTILRKTKTDAKRAVSILKQCGYRDVSFKQWTK